VGTVLTNNWGLWWK